MEQLKQLERFENELKSLINTHSVEKIANMPDFVLAKMICRMIEVIGYHVKENLDWHGCESPCHLSPETLAVGEGDVTNAKNSE